MQFSADRLRRAPERIYESFPTCFGEVTIQSLTETERCVLDSQNLDDDGIFDRKRAVLSRARMAIASIVDPETKQPMLTQDDMPMLGKSAKFCATVYARAIRLNGPDEKGSSTAKNSPATDVSDSPAE